MPQEWQGGRIARQPGVRLIHHRKGLALRNVKLRMSRKLLFASGLTSCFACELGIIENNCPKPRRPTAERCQECLLPMLQNPPSENLASAFLHVSGSAAPGLRSEIDESAAKAFSAYDEFVAMLADPEKRRHLDDLEPTNFEEDSVFTEARTLSRQFRDALQYLFFVGHSRQVDPTMAETREMLRRFGTKLSQVHLSEVTSSCQHEKLSLAAILAFRSVAAVVPERIPIILESVMGNPPTLHSRRRCVRAGLRSSRPGLLPWR